MLGVRFIDEQLISKFTQEEEGKKWKPAVPVPDVKTSALGMGRSSVCRATPDIGRLAGANRWMTDRL